MRPKNVTIEISHAERDAVLKNVSLADNIVARIRFAIQTREGLEFVLSGDDIVDFGDALVGHLKRIKNKAERIQVEGVLSRLIAHIRSGVPGNEALGEVGVSKKLVFPPDMPPEVRDAIQHLMDTHDFATPQELRTALHATMIKTNTTPRDELLGLNSAEAMHLTQSQWRVPGGALCLNENLTREAVADSTYCMDALRFLALTEKAGGLKLTTRKNLNRASVKFLLDEGCCPRINLASLTVRSSVINEIDVRPIHMAHILLQQARLTRHFKGKLLLTKAGNKILKEDRAGELQCSLFDSLYQRLNLAYLDRLPDYPGVQATIAFIFYVLHRKAQQPAPLKDLVDAVYLPGVRKEFTALPYANHSRIAFYTRVLNPLEGFGLVQITLSGEPLTRDPNLDTVQVTPLFNEMLQFNLKTP